MARLLVETGVILQNILWIRFLSIANAEVDRECEDHNIIPGAWRGDQQMEEIPQPQFVGIVLTCFVPASECIRGIRDATLTQWRIYGEWAYECNSPPIRNDHKVIARHS